MPETRVETMTTEVGSGERSLLLEEGIEHRLREIYAGSIIAVRDLEVRDRIADERQVQWIWAGRGPVLDGQREPLTFPAQVEVRVGPCVEVGRATQRQTRLVCRAVLAGVVDQEHGGSKLALQLSEEAQKPRDIGAGVLVLRMQSY